MNRRNFIKSGVIGAVGAPMIVSAISSPPILLSDKAEHIYIRGEFYEIMPIAWLKPYGIRASHYCMTFVDKNGYFAHEHESKACGSGYSDILNKEAIVRGGGNFTVFIVKTYRLQCLPIIHSDNPSYVNPVIGKVRGGVRLDGSAWSVEKIVDEIKDTMEYVCSVSYARVDKTPDCDPQFVPFARGLSKYHYNLYLKQMN